MNSGWWDKDALAADVIKDVTKDETVDDEHIIQPIVTSLLSSPRAKKSGKMTLTSWILVNDLLKVNTHFIKVWMTLSGSYLGSGRKYILMFKNLRNSRGIIIGFSFICLRSIYQKGLSSSSTIGEQGLRL